MNDDRLPPYDLEAEEAVLGSLLLDSDAMVKIIDQLKSGDFYRDKNQWIFEATCSLYERNEAINQVTVAHELGRRNRLEALGGSDYLSNLVFSVPTPLHIEHYASIVQRLSMMRRLIDTAHQISTIGYDAPPDTESALDKAETLLTQLRDGKSSGGFVHLGSVLNTYYDKFSMEEIPDGEVALPCVDTGFYQLDQILGGMHRCNLVILAARPGMGKTSLAINIARNAAIEQEAKVGLFSLEMSKEELARRFLSAESGINNRLIGKGTLSESQLSRLIQAFGVLTEAPIYIDESGGLTDLEMKNRARRLRDRNGVDLIIIDYIQLMRPGRAYIKNRVEEMTYISQALKDLARDVNVPVLALSQLSRAVESRVPHKPILSDLRDSGSIEQDADIVMFICRDEVYYSEEEWLKQNPELPYPDGEADVIVAKHRNGPNGEMKLHFNKSTTRFENASVINPDDKPEIQ
ncbi:MAG: replicative DNA helicase [Dehalococcoidia bacterium]